MHCKCQSLAQWKGPTGVLRQDGPVLFLRQMTRYIKAQKCCVLPVKPLPCETKASQDHQSIKYQNIDHIRTNINAKHRVMISKGYDNKWFEIFKWWGEISAA